MIGGKEQCEFCLEILPDSQFNWARAEIEDVFICHDCDLEEAEQIGRSMRDLPD